MSPSLAVLVDPRCFLWKVQIEDRSEWHSGRTWVAYRLRFWHFMFLLMNTFIHHEGWRSICIHTYNTARLKKERKKNLKSTYSICHIFIIAAAVCSYRKRVKCTCSYRQNSWAIRWYLACMFGKVFQIGTVLYNWPMSAHASQAFSIAHCTDSEDLPMFGSQLTDEHNSMSL